jgi:hypothetical protein
LTNDYLKAKCDQYGMPREVRSYAQLRRHFDKQQPWKGSKDRPFAHRKYSNRRMRMLDDETIELEYCNSPVARWHPDGTISVRAYPSRRWGVFMALPRQVRIDVGTRVGPIIQLFTTQDTDWWVETKLPSPDRFGRTFTRNFNSLVLRGNDWAHLYYCTAAKHWKPVDETQLEPFEWFEPDRSRTRRLSAEYNIPDFVTSAKALIGLALLTALKERDFATVLARVRRVERRTYDYTTGNWTADTVGVSSTDVKALRDRLCVLAGLCERKSAFVLPLKQYMRVERRLKDFGDPALC